MHQDEVGGPAFMDHPGLGFAEQFAAEPGAGGECLPRFHARLHHLGDLPWHLVGAQRSTAEVGACGDLDAGGPGEPQTLVGGLAPFGDLGGEVGAGEALERRGRAEGLP